jgi:hypothetical protein
LLDYFSGFFLNPAFVDKGDADDILSEMRRSVEKVGVPWHEFLEKLVSMGSDGVSVMLGKNNGVAAKLRLILIFLTLISPPMQILAYTISTSLTLQSVLPSDRIETNIEVLIESPIFLSSASAIYFCKFLATVSIKVSLPNVKAFCLIQFRCPAKHKA